MADDDRYRWLDRATAERLLSGESLEASLASADPEARDQAERLAKTLGALSVDTPPSSAELPGEAAALAAFRKSRPAMDAAPTTSTTSATSVTSVSSSDMGLVRVGGFGRRRGSRPARWGRPVRLGLSTALAACMVGSVAVAAGAGILPTPFGDDEPGRPTATVSAAESPDRMLVSPSPGVTRGKGVPSLRPDSTIGGSTGRDKGTEGPVDGGQGSRSDMGLPGDWRSGLASSCRDMRSGKELETDRRRALEEAAQGSEKVPQYCEDALKDDPAVSSNADTGTGTGTEPGQGDTGAEGDQSGQNGAGDDDGKGDGITAGNGTSDGNGHGNGGPGGRAATKPAPEPTSFVELKPDDDAAEPAPAPADSPSYGILPLPTAT